MVGIDEGRVIEFKDKGSKERFISKLEVDTDKAIEYLNKHPEISKEEVE